MPRKEAVMRLRKLAASFALLAMTGAQQPQSSASDAAATLGQASGNTEAIVVEGKWPSAPRQSQMPRHYMVAAWGVPAPYQGMVNPLQRRKEVLDRGQTIYKQYCAVCHGDNGAGNGLAGKALSPPPGNLVWLSDVPENQWDEFMYWTIAEGGTALGTSMPPYRQLLTRDEVWAVTAYIQEYIPFVSRMR
jgi:mono/diheme cytochrome c family protein